MEIIEKIESKEQYLWKILELSLIHTEVKEIRHLLAAVDTAYINNIDPKFALLESDNFFEFREMLWQIEFMKQKILETNQDS